MDELSRLGLLLRVLTLNILTVENIEDSFDSDEVHDLTLDVGEWIVLIWMRLGWLVVVQRYQVQFLLMCHSFSPLLIRILGHMIFLSPLIL